MISLAKLLFSWLPLVRSDKRDLLLEILALRQQLLVLQRKSPKPKSRSLDRLFWVLLSKLWTPWKQVLKVFQPKTVIGWQRGLFSGFWRWISRRKGGGRPKTAPATINLIKQMWKDNPTWGSPRIRRELLKLGITVSATTIRKYKPSRCSPEGQKWTTFLKNHVDSIVAVDFFQVPTATFRLLYVFIVMTHDRRRVHHFNVTESPTAFWSGQQIVNTFSFTTPSKYLLRDRDAIYGKEFSSRVINMNMEELKIAPRSPWQSPYVERLIGSIRRECLDHMIIFNASQLCRVLSRYFDYYHKIRPHKSLEDDAPDKREAKDNLDEKIIAIPVLGGLHHHYTRRAA